MMFTNFITGETKSPFYTGNDVVAVHTNNSFSTIKTSLAFYQYYENSDGPHQSSAKVSTQWLDNGVGVVFSLCEGWKGCGNAAGNLQIDGYCSNKGFYYNAYGNYAHQQVNLKLVPQLVLSSESTFDKAYPTNYQFLVD